MSRERELDAHLHAIRSVDGSCPQCSDTKRSCANTIAQMEVAYRTAALRQEPSVEAGARAICAALGYDPDGPVCDVYVPGDPDAGKMWAPYRVAAEAIAALYRGEA